MIYQPDQWNRCKKCGAHYPSTWARCGRCGHAAAKDGLAGSKGLILLALVLVIGYSYRETIENFKDDIIGVNHASVQNTGEGTNTESLGLKDNPDQASDLGEGDHVKEALASATPVPPVYDHVPPELDVSDASAEGSSSFESSEIDRSAISAQSAASATSASIGAVFKNEAAASSLGRTAHSASSDVIYNHIREALLAVSESVMLPEAAPSEMVFNMIQSIVQDEPRILFYEGCSYRSDGLLSLKYSKPKDYVLKARDKVLQMADKIIAEIIKPGMTDFEKELAIHDYIVNYCAYDRENYLKGTLPPESHSAYGVLVLGTAVCEGYAKTMKLLLDMVNIESRVINGKSMGQLHAWNLVKIENDWYHVDVTWDDPVMNDGSQTRQYTYLNLSDAQISSDHEWDRNAYPACQGTRFNYFFHTGNQVSSPDALLKTLIKKAEDGYNPIILKITDYNSERYNIPDLIQKAVYLLDADISYSVNEKYGVIQVWLGKD